MLDLLITNSFFLDEAFVVDRFFVFFPQEVKVIKVKKVLNNNVIVTRCAQNKEVIVMGKGLAFGLKIGDDIDQSRIDKTFALSNSKEVSRFQELVEQVSEGCLEMAERLIDFAKERLGKKLNNSIYITLTDHINTMMERAEVGAYLKNTMLWDIRRVHKDEFLVAQQIVERFNEYRTTEFDDHEAANITMHLVNAQISLGFLATTDITKVMSEILNIIKYNFRITYDEDSLSYYRLIVHLRSFAQRLFSRTMYSDTDDTELLEHIKKKYSKSYHCSQLIKKYIHGSYGYELEDEECMYLTIHIEKVVKESFNQ